MCIRDRVPIELALFVVGRVKVVEVVGRATAAAIQQNLDIVAAGLAFLERGQVRHLDAVVDVGEIVDAALQHRQHLHLGILDHLFVDAVDVGELVALAIDHLSLIHI